MSKDNGILEKEDYVEPSCVLCGDPYGTVPEVKPVPQQRIIQKMDEYMSRRDYAGAERHLLYWLEEAKLGNDLRGQLMLRNELVGHYRKTGNKEKAFENGEEALRLLDVLGFEGTISSGTACVNYATALNAFGENEKSIGLFEKARQIYESSANTRLDLLGGLYNNMALTCMALKQYERAHHFYDLAMETMKKVPGGELEQAITCLNRANLVEAEMGLEAGEHRIFDLLDTAYDLLKQPHPDAENGYTAFVFEKCAPTFSYYGYFMAADELKKEAERLYAGN